MRNYETLDVWKNAHQHVLRAYAVTRAFPADERYALVLQVRRAAVSVAANIAEGADRPTNPQFIQHLGYATGSAAELDYYWRLSRDLGYIPGDHALDLTRHVRRIRRQIFALTRYLRRTTP